MFKLSNQWSTQSHRYIGNGNQSNNVFLGFGFKPDIVFIRPEKRKLKPLIYAIRKANEE